MQDSNRSTFLNQIGSSFPTKCFKFLGIHIDDQLSWSYHINYIHKQISKSLYMLRQARKYLPLTCLRTLYFAMIHSHLAYGTIIWGNASALSLKKLQLGGKSAVRSIFNSEFRAHTEPLFKEAKILKLSDMYTFQILIFLSDFKKQVIPRSFNNLFVQNKDIQPQHQTRQTNHWHIPRSNSQLFSKSPVCNFPKQWNQYSDVLSSPTNISVNTLLKNHFLSKYNSLVTCNNPTCWQCNSCTTE